MRQKLFTVSIPIYFVNVDAQPVERVNDHEPASIRRPGDMLTTLTEGLRVASIRRHPVDGASVTGEGDIGQPGRLGGLEAGKREDACCEDEEGTQGEKGKAEEFEYVQPLPPTPSSNSERGSKTYWRLSVFVQ
jgi:hypothetical protein